MVRRRHYGILIYLCDLVGCGRSDLGKHSRLSRQLALRLGWQHIEMYLMFHFGLKGSFLYLIFK